MKWAVKPRNVIVAYAAMFSRERERERESEGDKEGEIGRVRERVEGFLVPICLANI